MRTTAYVTVLVRTWAVTLLMAVSLLVVQSPWAHPSVPSSAAGATAVTLRTAQRTGAGDLSGSLAPTAESAQARRAMPANTARHVGVGTASRTDKRPLAAAAMPCSKQFDVQTTENACATTVAVSVTGNASGRGCNQMGCMAVSGTGNSNNTVSGGSCKGVGCSAGACGFGGAGCIAVSGTGDASNRVTGNCQGNGCAGASCGFGGAAGCVAVSGTGHASNTVSGNCTGEGCAAGTCGFGGFGCVAVSGTGDATNNVTGTCRGTACGAGACGLGCVAVSGTGRATNNIKGTCRGAGCWGSGCDTGCVAVQGPPLLPRSTHGLAAQRPSGDVHISAIAATRVAVFVLAVQRLGFTGAWWRTASAAAITEWSGLVHLWLLLANK